jgi:hypothetical protein
MRAVYYKDGCSHGWQRLGAVAKQHLFSACFVTAHYCRVNQTDDHVVALWQRLCEPIEWNIIRQKSRKKQRPASPENRRILVKSGNFR